MLSDKPLRVALFSPGWPPGRNPNGIVGYVDNLRRGLAELGAESRVLAFEAEDAEDAVPVWGSFARVGLLPKAAQWMCYRALPDDALMFQTVADAIVAARALRRSWRFDLVEVEETRGGSHWIGAAVRVPVVVRLHGPWFLNGVALGVPQDRGFHLRVRREGTGIERAAGVTAPSRDVLERVRNHYGLALPHAQVIPNPGPRPDPQFAWSHQAREPDHILVVGRFDRHKGGDVAVDALALLLGRRPGVRLTFAGPDSGFLDDSGRKWSFEEYVRAKLPPHQHASIEMLGRVDQARLAELRQRASVVISASRYDNFPLAVLEAAAQGCPVVCSDNGGSREIVESGVTGLVFESGSAPALAAQIQTLLERPELAADFGEKLLGSYNSRYLPEIVARETLDFYANICDRHRRRGKTGASESSRARSRVHPT